jgi:hypothetical protein
MIAAHYYVFVGFVNRDSLFLARVSVLTAAGNPAWSMICSQARPHSTLKGQTLQPETFKFARYVMVFTTCEPGSAAQVLQWYRMRGKSSLFSSA